MTPGLTKGFVCLAFLLSGLAGLLLDVWQEIIVQQAGQQRQEAKVKTRIVSMEKEIRDLEGPGPTKALNPESLLENSNSPETGMDTDLLLSSLFARKGLRLESLARNRENRNSGMRLFRTSGRLEGILACLGDFTDGSALAFYQLDIARTAEGQFSFQGSCAMGKPAGKRNRTLAPGSGSQSARTPSRDSDQGDFGRLAALLSHSGSGHRTGNHPGQVRNPGSEQSRPPPASPDPQSSQAVPVPSTQLKPSAGRFVLRGISGEETSQVFLLKDLVLDRMIWVPGDPDWTLVDQGKSGLIIMNSEGKREEVKQ